MGREKGWHHFLSFPFPSSLARFPFFPLPSLLMTQRGLCGGEWYSHLLVRSVLQTLVPHGLGALLLLLLPFFIKQIAGSILFGAGCSGIHVALKLHSERGPHDQPLSSAENWSIFTDGALAPQAEKLIYHIIR